MQASAVNAEAAAAKAEVCNTNKYAAITATHLFVPSAFEKFRALETQAQKFVGDLGENIKGITGDIRETPFRKQRLSITKRR